MGQEAKIQESQIIIGKRDPKEIIDKQVASSKKQKVVQGGVGDEESCDEEPAKQQTVKIPQATGKKTLCIGNLSSLIREADVINFFKSVADVVKIHLVKKDDQFQGYGYVEFATPEAAEVATRLRKKPLLDRPVFLDLVADTGTFPPASGGNKRSFQKGRGKTVVVRGYGTDLDTDDFVNVTHTLWKHFGECGTITNITIPEFYDSGGLRKADCFICFNDSVSVIKALELDGSNVGNCKITVDEVVEEAKPRGDGGGGSGSGHGGGHGVDGSRSGGPGTGKKTTFGEE